MKYITLEYILKLHCKMITRTGGAEGIRDVELLKSAIENSKVTFDDTELYKTIPEKCSVICFSIINNHPFVDGNKRMGIYIMLILLEYNNIKLSFNQNELIELGLKTASGVYTKEDILNWIRIHM